MKNQILNWSVPSAIHRSMLITGLLLIYRFPAVPEYETHQPSFFPHAMTETMQVTQAAGFSAVQGEHFFHPVQSPAVFDEIIIDPDPVTDHSFTVHFSEMISGELQVSIYNLTGMKLLEQEFVAAQKPITKVRVFAALKRGDYIIEVNTTSGKFDKRITVVTTD